MAQECGVAAAMLAVALALGALTLLAGRRLAPHPRNADDNPPPEYGARTAHKTWVQFRVRYALVALLFVVFDMEMVYMFPWAAVFKRLGLVAFLDMFVFIAILAAAIAFSWKLGAFEGGVIRYFAVDGGHGANLLAALAGYDPRLQPVASPRHADLLLVVEPISRKLVPALAEVARALPCPRRVLLAGDVPRAERIRGEELLPGAFRVEGTSPGQVAGAMLSSAAWQEVSVTEEFGWEPDSRPLSSREELELATEPASSV